MKSFLKSLVVVLMLASLSMAADLRLQYGEKIRGANAPGGLEDTANRLTNVEHDTDGTHKKLSPNIRILKAGESLATVIAEYPSAEVTLLITDNVISSGTVTVTSNIGLRFEKPGKITKSGAGTLTINGPFSAGLYQVFSGFSAGDVAFGTGNLKEVYPEWWNINTTPGTTDMSTAINSAIMSVTINGGVVIVPESNHRAGAQIAMKSNVILRGLGYKSSIYWTGGNTEAIRGTGISNFSIENLRVYSTGLTDSDVPALINIINGSSNGKIKNCWVDTGYLGIVIGSVDPGTTGSSDILIDHNIISNLGLNGISINSYGHDFIVTNNLIYNVGQVATGGNVAAGAELRGQDRITFADNIIRDCNYTGPVDGVRLEYGSEGTPHNPKLVSIHHNIIDTMSGYGLRLQYAQNTTISDNVINNTALDGIVVLSSNTQAVSQYSTISNNTISSNPNSAGINVEGASSSPSKFNIISNNTVASCYYGIKVTFGDDNVFSGNNVSGGTYGFQHNSGNRNQVIGGKYTNAAIGINLIAGANLSITNVELYTNTTYGLQINSAVIGTKLTSNRIYNNVTNDVIDNSTACTEYVDYGTAPPTAGTYAKCSRRINNLPAVGQPKSWVCTVAGSPGTWVSEGNL